MNAVIIIGLPLLIAGICGIVFITIPSFENIGQQAQNVGNDNSTGKIVQHVGSAILSGILLYFTTGLFVVLIILGLILTLAGAVGK